MSIKNNWTVIAHLTADCVTRKVMTKSGKERYVTNFDVAINYYNGSANMTEYAKCEYWGSTEPKVATWLTRGREVACGGTPYPSAFIGKDGQLRAQQRMRVEEIALLDGKGRAQTDLQEEELSELAFNDEAIAEELPA